MSFRRGAPGFPWLSFRYERGRAKRFEASCFARLNEVHQNAVKHGVAIAAEQYPWCSAGWFRKTATSDLRKTVYGFRTDTFQVEDDF